MLRRLGYALLVLALASLLALWLVWEQWRPGMPAYQAHGYAEPAASGALNATWLGVTGVLLSDGTDALLIDPFFTRPEGLLPVVVNGRIAPDEARIRSGLALAGEATIRAVLVSHSHYDHAMDAGVATAMSDAELVGSASTANIGRGAGVGEAKLRVVQPGVAMQFGPFKVTFIESRHAGASGGRPTGTIDEPLITPARYIDYKLGGTYSILVEHPRGKVLHHGSAGYVLDALGGHKADVVFLGVAIVDDLVPYLAETVDAVGARRVIPVHWDDFTRPLAGATPFPALVRLDRFFDHMNQRGDLQVQTLQPNRTVALFPAPP